MTTLEQAAGQTTRGSSRGGVALIATGVFHTLVGVAAYGATLADIAGEGVFNAIGANPGPTRDAALWFLVTGVLLIVLGRLARWAQRSAGTLPRSLGWSVIGVAALVGVPMPASGWPLVAGAGVLLLRAAVRTGRSRLRWSGGRPGPPAPGGGRPVRVAGRAW